MVGDPKQRLQKAVEDVAALIIAGREDELPAGERRSSGQCPVALKLSEIVGTRVYVGSHGAFTLGAYVVEMPPELRDWIRRFDSSPALRGDYSNVYDYVVDE